MAVPDYQSIMLPLLRLAEDGQEHSLRAAIQSLADNFELQDSERKELLPSGRQFKFDNRVGWARTYLKKAGLLDVVGCQNPYIFGGGFKNTHNYWVAKS
ncbi:Mrr restriction system protein [Halorhodospira halochloris]|uniref:Mrr restriction system protein n=1 Tax=Halorhodospira halochloris TaxID=1052 RepID=A0A0X8X9U1_HALHR|nr:winged helix-turn-helix domain-containing protein [Halorhodospira halochloris]MBK1652992.1 hypothetical protein [Halorhodospira halochloris]BAU58124.1 Mrr restriction system protein [Halorhodospira halochloris]